MIKVDVFLQNDTWKKYISNPKKYLNNKLKIIDNTSNFFKKQKFKFSILLGGDKENKKLNKKFRKKNKSTDVLSFPFYNIKEFKKQKKGIIYLGDVILNFNKINKKDFKNDFDRLWVHGFLHLMGYKHFTNKDYKKMNKMEISILKKIRKN